MQNKLHLYTGEGKGKTTAAMGLALRSIGHERRVLIAQFMKNGRSGELLALAQFPGVILFEAKPIEKFTSRMNEEELAEEAIVQTAQANELIDLIAAEKPAITVQDELGMALHHHLVDDETAQRLIDVALVHGECVVTGRYAPDWLIARADYVSRIMPDKHPFETEGLHARRGIEW
ncbi:MAG: cob(I)yrinic acid a,c-diamide adenosyltransferase [Clostridiales bacterium]|nr:cob(I)yrinic acid a,c-diamide adenosyltransferase [Clostridiales bacterium]